MMKRLKISISSILVVDALEKSVASVFIKMTPSKKPANLKLPVSFGFLIHS